MLIEFLVMCQKIYGDKAKALRFMPLSVFATQLNQGLAHSGQLIDADDLETPEKYGFNTRMIQVCDEPDSGVYTEGDMMVAWVLYRDGLVSLIEPNDVESFKRVCFSALMLRLSNIVSKTVREPLQYGQVARNMLYHWNELSELADDYQDKYKGLADPLSNVEEITHWIKTFCNRIEENLKNSVKTYPQTTQTSDIIIPGKIEDDQQVKDKFGKKYQVSLTPLQQRMMEDMGVQYNQSAKSQDAIIVDSSDEMIPAEIRIKMLDTIEQFDIDEDITKVELGETNKSLDKCPKCESTYVVYSGLGQVTCMECDHAWNVVVNTTEITPEMELEYQEKMKRRKEIAVDTIQATSGPKSIKRVRDDNDT